MSDLERLEHTLADAVLERRRCARALRAARQRVRESACRLEVAHADLAAASEAKEGS